MIIAKIKWAVRQEKCLGHTFATDRSISDPKKNASLNNNEGPKDKKTSANISWRN